MTESARAENISVVRDHIAGINARYFDCVRMIYSSSRCLRRRQWNTDLLAGKVHPYAGKMELRSNPPSCGGGYLLATGVGSATGNTNAGFYGHLIPSGVAVADTGDCGLLALLE